MTDKGMRCYYIKMRIRSQTILFSSIKKKKEKEEEITLNTKLFKLAQEYAETTSDTL